MSELLPCPFCGGKAEIKHDEDIAFARCKDCEATGPTILGPRDDSEIDWNTRPVSAEPNKDVLMHFCESLRGYERESHNLIGFDERETIEFVDIYLNEVCKTGGKNE